MDSNTIIRKAGLVPVVVIEDADKAVPTAKALYAGGINVMEITLRTAAGLEAIRNVSREYPEVLVGAGTVLTLEQAKAAVASGAKFIVSPGLDEDIVRYCQQEGIAVYPGCVTPTEITQALKLGLTTLKFFPANVYGGIEAMKALHGPVGMVEFIPTGGASLKNLGDYANVPFIAAVGGGFLASKADINNENYQNITDTARKAVELWALNRLQK